MPKSTELMGPVVVEPIDGGGVRVFIVVSDMEQLHFGFDRDAALDHIAKLQAAVKGQASTVLQRAKPSIVVPGVRIGA